MNNLPPKVPKPPFSKVVINETDFKRGHERKLP